MAARISVLLFLTFWACSGAGKKVLDHTFPGQVWRDGDTLWADIAAKTAGTPYDLSLEVGLKQDYPWRNLYLMTIWEQPDGFRQTSRIELSFQDETGVWYTRGGRYQVFLVRGGRFSGAGRYRLGLLPYVRADSVPGIRFLKVHLYVQK